MDAIDVRALRAMTNLTSSTGLRLQAIIVDDNENMRTLLKRILSRIGVTCVEFPDGSAALAAIATIQPDFILTDLTMAPMDGLTFARTLRASTNDKIRLIPIIMITGHTEKHHIEAARDHGVNEILAKPITTAALMQRIEMIIYKPRPFVRTQAFFGPDRRRRNKDIAAGFDRRKEPKPGA
jgi:two-component system chemotaxis response regulator CheY